MRELPEEIRSYFDRTISEAMTTLQNFVKASSSARLLAENEPIGDLVALTLLDDAPVECKLWVHLRNLAAWLEETEERYRQQFPADFPQSSWRYDLSQKPEGFRTRFEIFKELVQRDESNPVWATEVDLQDPVVVRKKFRHQRKQPPTQP